MEDLVQVVQKQREFFNTDKTKEVSFRVEMLKRLKSLLKKYEVEFYQAIYDDLGKSEIETFMTEFFMLYQEIDLFIKKIRLWSEPKKVRSDMINFPAKSYIIPEPYGTVLVFGTWNYPYQLSLLPVVSAIAAGNTVVLHPSHVSENSSRVMQTLINKVFPEQYLKVITGGREVIGELLEQHFDMIFYTGSKKVGQIVYSAAAKYLTPVVLELGGKSPTFVLRDCDVAVAARRIVWAKCLNAGQTCVAPDYVLCDEMIKDDLLLALKQEMDRYPQTSSEKEDYYMNIINPKNMERLKGLINEEKVCFGGVVDMENRFISPTLLDGVTWDDAVMQQEIFGPILPVLTFKDMSKALDDVKKHDRPLACYVFTKNRNSIDKILKTLSFGGGCVNDCIMHLTNHYLPFGGVGSSGFGQYHGHAGFRVFTHYKSILDKPIRPEVMLRYPPYTSFTSFMLRKLSKK